MLFFFFFFYSTSQVDRSRKKLPLPPPEGGDDEGPGILNVVAMYDFAAKEDTDLTLKQVTTKLSTFSSQSLGQTERTDV